jgi:hypothetical protein
MRRWCWSYVVHVTVVKKLDVNSICNEMPEVIGCTPGTRSWCYPLRVQVNWTGWLVGAVGWQQ